MRPVRVKRHGANLTTVNALTNVEIPEGCFADGAAVACLVRHLGFDVLTTLANHPPVEDIRQCLHNFASQALTEVLTGRQQVNANAGELLLSVASVDVVTEDARPVVVDHRINVAILVQESEHFAELRPLLNGLRRVARLNEHLDDNGPELSSEGAAPLVLCVD
nr:hypothetical protein [Streptomyces capoamus]